MPVDQQREEEAEYSSDKVYIMVDGIVASFAHIVRIYQIKNAHNNARYRNYSVEIEFFPWSEEDKEKQNSRNRT